MNVLKAANFFLPGRDFHVAIHRMLPGNVGYHTHHGFLEFSYVLDGSVRHAFNGGEERLSAGALVLIRERDAHGVVGAPGVETRFANIAFTTDFLARLARFARAPRWPVLLRDAGALLAVHFKGAEHAAFSKRLEAASAEFPGRDDALRALTVEVCARLLPAPEAAPDDWASKAGEPPLWLRELCVTLHGSEHLLTRPQVLPGLAHKSPEHLSRAFRKHLGMTPTDFLNARRLDQAAQALVSSDEKLLSIAFRCGFETPGYFYRLFRKRFGVTPRQYRKSARGLIDTH